MYYDFKYCIQVMWDKLEGCVFVVEIQGSL